MGEIDTQISQETLGNLVCMILLSHPPPQVMCEPSRNHSDRSLHRASRTRLRPAEVKNLILSGGGIQGTSFSSMKAPGADTTPDSSEFDSRARHFSFFSTCGGAESRSICQTPVEFPAKRMENDATSRKTNQDPLRRTQPTGSPARSAGRTAS